MLVMHALHFHLTSLPFPVLSKSKEGGARGRFQFPPPRGRSGGGSVLVDFDNCNGQYYCFRQNIRQYLKLFISLQCTYMQ